MFCTMVPLSSTLDGIILDQLLCPSGCPSIESQHDGVWSITFQNTIQIHSDWLWWFLLGVPWMDFFHLSLCPGCHASVKSNVCPLIAISCVCILPALPAMSAGGHWLSTSVFFVTRSGNILASWHIQSANCAQWSTGSQNFSKLWHCWNLTVYVHVYPYQINFAGLLLCLQASEILSHEILNLQL